MKVMVTQNVKMDLNITNGAREVMEEILPPDESGHVDQPIVKLKYLPGLEESVIRPAEISMRTFRVNITKLEQDKVMHTVCPQQCPITPASAFTDYRVKGPTSLRYMCDRGYRIPPTGRLSLLNIYVALSRTSGQIMIWLLHDFDGSVFLTVHDPELSTYIMAKDDRLNLLGVKTKAGEMVKHSMGGIASGKH
ncbi:hypothetical protein OE88DRAFT_772306 [Heliocybe sulcata]|uniref:Uncharacterized protein n=1 Tax=Heliocybe sulcata TaxID=5364 RepID=A0A5C3MUW1_9AGAM|nr:hypothetical protein OE88DRAFT_772306 [Heliocybe sulcata]